MRIESSRTLVILVEIGDRRSRTKYTLPRLTGWTRRHSYDLVLWRRNELTRDLIPHFNKLLAATSFPGYDRYVIVDDDVLVSSTAPALPEVPAGHVGLARDPQQANTSAAHVEWTGNSGFVIFDHTALPLIKQALDGGEVDGIWPGGDQAAVNDVFWRAKKVFELDQRWNYQPIPSYFLQHGGWESWKSNRLKRLSYFATAALSFPTASVKASRGAFALHLTFVQPKQYSIFDRLLS